MPRRRSRLPAEKVLEFDMTIKDMKLGTMTVLGDNRTPPQAVIESLNKMQVKDNVWAHKWGSEWFSTAAPDLLDGAFAAVNPDGSTEIIEVAGGGLYRSQNGGTKTSIATGAAGLTAGHRCFFKQIGGYVYITNYIDPVARYNTTTKTAAGYVALTTPVAPTLAIHGMTGSQFEHHYVIVATNLVGTTVGSPEVSVSSGLARDSWSANATVTNVTNTIDITITRVTNATRYSIFYSDQSGYERYLTSVADPGTGTTFIWTDNGEIPINDFVELPDDDTTGGPVLGPMELSGNRIWSIQADGAVVWGGVGQYQGVFSSYYGGGYIYLEKGGREKPTVTKHFRDGKGSAMATVFTTDPEGNGSTWQVSLDTVTVGATSFIVPTAVKIVGSIGAAGPLAACAVGDDIIYGNAKGAFSLGSQPSLLNVLATRELSVNVRDRWRGLNRAALDDMAMYYYDAKLFNAVPNNSTSNSEIWIRDIEKSNWQLAWEGVAVASFFEYVDTSGKNHFLAVPVSDTRLIELSPDIKGDFGRAFATRLKTGILPVSSNHNKFAQLTQMFLEVGNPLGSVHMDVYGYDYKKGFTFLGSMDVTGGAKSGVPWGYEWSTESWSYIEDMPVIETPSIVRNFKRINNLVNSLQFVITTAGLTDYHEFLEINMTGFLVDVDPPRAWKVAAAPSLDRTIMDYLLDDTGSYITDSDGQPIVVV